MGGCLSEEMHGEGGGTIKGTVERDCTFYHSFILKKDDELEYRFF
jgi:hypothetical protein